MRLIETMICTMIIGLMMMFSITSGLRIIDRVETKVIESYRIYNEYE